MGTRRPARYEIWVNDQIVKQTPSYKVAVAYAERQAKKNKRVFVKKVFEGQETITPIWIDGVRQ